MLFATLPTFTNDDEDFVQTETIVRHPEIDAVRYNTGGASPLTPRAILEAAKNFTDRFGKPLYVDLEGRQIRVAQWTPQSRGSVVLNRNFTIELPAQIHFRGAGWFDIVGADPNERRIFFKPRETRKEYFLGESQSVHILAKRLEVDRYLGGLDYEYLYAAVDLGITRFMLSFVEGHDDIAEFEEAYARAFKNRMPEKSQVVLKIESKSGLSFIEHASSSLFEDYQLMAARDDLFLGLGGGPEILGALKAIVWRDPGAILASRIFSGLEREGAVSMSDYSDLLLMRRMGYQNFMLSDSISKHHFVEAMDAWNFFCQVAPVTA